MHFRLPPLFVSFSLLFCALAFVLGNDAAPVRFEPLGPFGGDARSLLLDPRQPEVVYLGTSNGTIFKSVNSGKSWERLHPGIGRRQYVIDTLVAHPAHKDHIYAGGWDMRSDGGGLFESKDAGRTWSQVVLAKDSLPAVRDLAINRARPEYMIAGTLAGPYVTSDGGRSWKRVGGSEVEKARSVAIDPEDYRVLYVGTWRLSYRSTDFGKTWTRLSSGMPLDSDVMSIAVDRRDPKVVFSSACSGVYRSASQGKLWTRLRVVPDRFTVRAHLVYLDPVNPKRVYTGTTEGLFVSNNDGQTWTRLTAKDVVVNAVQVNPEDNKKILVGTEYGGVLRSEDGGRTWQESNTGFIHRQISWIRPADDGSGFIAGLASGGGGMYAFDAASGKWTQSQIEPGMRIHSYLVLPGKGKLAGTPQGLYHQAREGAPWTKVKGSIAKRTVYSLALDPKHPVVFAGTDQGIYRASLATATLDFRLPAGYRFSPQVWCIATPGTGTGLVYAGSSLGLLRSWDRGAIWNVVSSRGLPVRTPINSIAVSPADDKHLFAGTPVGLYESTDGGIHWTRAGDGGLDAHIPSVIFLDDAGKRILAADRDSGGVFLSKDGGKTFVKYAPAYDIPATVLVQDPQNPSRVLMGTHYDGTYVITISE